MVPETKYELKQYILESLGEPVIKVNISEVQLNNAVDDAVDFWSEFHVNGQDHTYLKIQINEHHIEHNAVYLPDSVMAVMSILNPMTDQGPVGSSGGFGTYEYEMTRDMIYQMAGGGTGACSGMGGGGNETMVGSYVVARQYLETINHYTKPGILYDYRYHKGYVSIAGGIDRYFKVGDYMVLEVQGYLYKDSYNVWGDRALRKLAAAYAKKIWGMNLKKFSGVTLPSGVTLNGDSIYADALQDIEQAEEYIKGQQEPLGIIIG